MTGPNGETWIVLPSKPRDAEYVRCPSCGLIRWRDDGDLMLCPDDLTEAETFDPDAESAAGLRGNEQP